MLPKSQLSLQSRLQSIVAYDVHSSYFSGSLLGFFKDFNDLSVAGKHMKCLFYEARIRTHLS